MPLHMILKSNKKIKGTLKTLYKQDQIQTTVKKTIRCGHLYFIQIYRKQT